MLDKIIEVKVNQKELTKVLKEMSLFDDMKQEIEAFHADEKRVEDQQKYVEKQLQELQQKYTQNMLEQETANVTEVIYLRMQTKKMKEEMQVLEAVLADVEAEGQELLFTYYTKFKEALGKAGANASQYDFTPVLTNAIAEILAVAKELGAEANEQYKEVYPDISYVFFDNKVMERYPRIMSTYDANNYKPRFKWSDKTVLGKEQFQNAIYYGQIPDKFKIKDVE